MAGVEATTAAPEAGFVDTVITDTTYPIVAVIGCLGVINNTFAIVTTFTSSVMRKKVKVVNVLLANRCCVDLVISLLLLAYTGARTTYGDSLVGVRGEVVCRLWMSKMPIWSMLVSSLFNLEVITVEKYFAIVHPHRRRLAQHKNAIVAMVLLAVWLFGPCYTIPFTVSTSDIVQGVCYDNKVWVSPSSSKVFAIINFAVKYVIPLCMFAFCYTCMLIALRNKINVGFGGVFTVQSQYPTEPQREHVFYKAKYNIFKTMIAIVIGHLCCWSIEEIVRFIIYFGSPSDVPSSLPTIAEILVYCNCCVNPLILLASYAEFRRTVYANFRRWLSPFMSKSRSVSNGVQEQQQRSSSGAGDGPRRSRATAKDQLTTHLVDQVKVSRMEQDVITPPSTSHS